MMRMLTAAIGRLTRRERGLLGALVFVAVPLALAFLVALPLLQARDAAHARKAEAEALYAWVRARDADWRAQGDAGPQGAIARAAPVGIAGIERDLTARDLRRFVTSLETRANGHVRLALEGASFVDVARFLERAGADLGYGLANMTLAPGDSAGQVKLRLDLAP